jgi:pimeloyl-ACP methyl ester carboxylesterase
LPTVVLLHGISASGTSFAPLFMRLREHTKRIIVPDYPGHGLSEEPSRTLTLDALFDAMTGVLDELLGDEPVVVIGNSLGGAVALDYVAKRASKLPGSVRSVVLLSPAGAHSSEAEWQELLNLFGMKNRRESIAFMRRVYHRMLWPMRLLAHELPANVRRRGVADLFASVSSESQVPAGELGKLTMPILFLWGESERLLPGAHLAWWKRHLPKQAVVERPAGMGHCPHVDAPGPLTHRIVSFLRENVTIPS